MSGCGCAGLICWSSGRGVALESARVTQIGMMNLMLKFGSSITRRLIRMWRVCEAVNETSIDFENHEELLFFIFSATSI
jgi:hypothetical protein